ncbi:MULTISPECIES: HrpE/YscL family type III secretion apparatus protein [Providencia]|uniref:HrpE/YscL family type III secretion apparatus protein n=1 Tax=Providencia huashanensis TaxID=3037798 RepID=A0AA42FJW5_9GAMM|nr:MULTISPECIES: HrpE/YscL family type III secretion apparatus protein [Providencia]EJD6663774.1 hypothetical protein [Providencia rettgeri]ELR5079239.1 hypothetical protein [Providencia rettgeri]ELR5174655.1 hypothetical protein [Providencia rettgeri]ELR5197358.1 hypothetical protein [Providencia rettgeri]EMB8480156.1 hypothetical protein [Providencia rettgeri]
MKVISVPVISLPDLPVFGPIIPTEELINCFSANNIIEIAQQKAQIIYQESQKYLDETKQECQSLRELAYQEGMALLEDEAPLIRQKIATESIEWLVSEHQLEQNILMCLEPRLREVLVSVLDMFFIENDSTGLLFNQLRTKLEEIKNEKSATLYIHPSQYNKLIKLFSGYPWLHIQVDETKDKDEALLSSSLFNLHINLKEQLESICAHLLLAEEETCNVC